MFQMWFVNFKIVDMNTTRKSNFLFMFDLTSMIMDNMVNKSPDYLIALCGFKERSCQKSQEHYSSISIFLIIHSLDSAE